MLRYKMMVLQRHFLYSPKSWDLNYDCKDLKPAMEVSLEEISIAKLEEFQLGQLLYNIIMPIYCNVHTVFERWLP